MLDLLQPGPHRALCPPLLIILWAIKTALFVQSDHLPQSLLLHNYACIVQKSTRLDSNLCLDGCDKQVRLEVDFDEVSFFYAHEPNLVRILLTLLPLYTLTAVPVNHLDADCIDQLRYQLASVNIDAADRLKCDAEAPDDLWLDGASLEIVELAIADGEVNLDKIVDDLLLSEELGPALVELIWVCHVQ